MVFCLAIDCYGSKMVAVTRDRRRQSRSAIIWTMIEALRRIFLAILFFAASVYAGVAFAGGLFALLNAAMFTKCLVSAGFDLTMAGISFDVLTQGFSSFLDAIKLGGLGLGPLLGTWGAWHTLRSGVNPFRYMWERVGTD